MNTLFIYMVKVAIYITAFYLVYAAMLSRDTSYVRNRTFILVSLVTSVVLPYFTLQTVRPLDIQFFGKLLSEVFITATPSVGSPQAYPDRQVDILQVVYSAYIIGALTYMIKLLFNLANLLFLIVRQRKAGSRIIRFHGFNTAGFSAMGYIFINTRLNPEEAGSVVRHEQNHLKRKHFIDIVFIEVIKALQWFNPAVYMFDRSLRAVHEFQADEECISSGVPVISYQSLLLSQVFKSGSINLTNSFSNPSLIKRRMIMMTKKRTSALAGLKLVAVIPVISLVFLAISAYKEIPEKSIGIELQAELRDLPEQIAQDTGPASDMSSNSLPAPSLKITKDKIISSTNGSSTISSAETAAPPPPPPPPPSEIKKEVYTRDASALNQSRTESEPFVVVEEMPVFPGGDAALLRYIGENTTYPPAAKENNIQGRVIVRFCVTESGGINRVGVLKGVSPDLDAEAIRVVSALPEFFPGRQGGKAVPVWFSVPITFTLK